MKNFIGTIFVSFLLLFGASGVNASPFTIDLGAINTAIGTSLYQFVNPTTSSSTIDVGIDLSVQTELNNWSQIDQSFGPDSILNDGDTFTEFGYLGVLSWDGSNNINIFDSNNDQWKMYIKFDNLTGHIDAYSGGTIDVGLPGTRSDNGDTNFTTDISDDSYDIYFDNTVNADADTSDADIDANVTIFLRNVTNSMADITLATLDVLTGEGQSAEFINGVFEGQFGITLDFTTYDDVSNDVWWVNGMTFAAWEALYADSITMGSENLGATGKAPATLNSVENTFTQFVENDGELNVNAVPEPTTMILFGIGLLGFAGVFRKKAFLN